MNKYTLQIFILLSLCLNVSAWSLIEPVSDDYYDKKEESIMVPLRNCDFVVGFEFYGRAVTVVGASKKIHRKIVSHMPKMLMKKITYNQQTHYDGYHEEEHYEYFLAQVPSDGYMQLNYTFTDRTGKVMLRSEKVFKPRYGQKFPSKEVIPRECMSNAKSRYMKSFR